MEESDKAKAFMEPAPVPKPSLADSGRAATPRKRREASFDRLTRSGAAIGPEEVQKQRAAYEAQARAKRRSSFWRVFLVLIGLGLIALAILWVLGVGR